MALFRTKFACNLAISNLVFIWESCNGNMWESVKKCSRLCSEGGTRGWILRVAHGLQAARRCTWVKHTEKLNRRASCSTTGQKVQTGYSVSSQLGLATQSSRQSSNSSTLTISIVTSLRGTLAKTFSHHTHTCEKAIWCLGSN